MTLPRPANRGVTALHERRDAPLRIARTADDGGPLSCRFAYWRRSINYARKGGIAGCAGNGLSFVLTLVSTTLLTADVVKHPRPRRVQREPKMRRDRLNSAAALNSSSIHKDQRGTGNDR